MVTNTTVNAIKKCCIYKEFVEENRDRFHNGRYLLTPVRWNGKLYITIIERSFRRFPIVYRFLKPKIYILLFQRTKNNNLTS